MKAPARDSYQKFGSIRILRDDRVRFSTWTFPGLRYLGFVTKGESIEVERGGRVVLYLWAPRGRLASACFAYDLSPDDLQTLVSELRSAGRGLERWIVPALEYTQATLYPTDHGRQLLEVIPGFLKSCQDLPMAEQWKKVRANAFANAERARAERETRPRRKATRQSGGKAPRK